MIQYRRNLPELMKSLKLSMIGVELGCAEGYSALEFLQGGIEKLYMVDTWATINGQKGDGSNHADWHNKNLNDAKNRVKKYGESAIFLRGLTIEMAWMIPDNTCGLVYIDAAHDLENVRMDIINYWSKLVSGGIMAFHDYENENYGVKQAVNDFANYYNLPIHLIPEEKKDDAGALIIKP